MDTNTAIATLQGIAQTLTDEVKGNQAKLDAVNLAISQLDSTLVTQLADSASKDLQIADLSNQVANAVALAASKDAAIDAANAAIADLQSQLANANPVQPAPLGP